MIHPCQIAFYTTLTMVSSTSLRNQVRQARDLTPFIVYVAPAQTKWLLLLYRRPIQTKPKITWWASCGSHQRWEWLVVRVEMKFNLHVTSSVTWLRTANLDLEIFQKFPTLTGVKSSKDLHQVIIHAFIFHCKKLPFVIKNISYLYRCKNPL